MTAPMPDYSKLSPEEINRLCAERVGWTRSTVCFTHDNEPLWKAPCGMEYYSPPDYCRDRNALGELWDHMTDEHWSKWKFEISKLVGVDDEKVSIGLLATMRQAVTATPRQHAEAFLKATEPGT